MVRILVLCCFLLPFQGVAQNPADLLQLTFPKGVVFEARYIPSGNVHHGDGEGAPSVSYVDSFWLGQTEVTLGQWQAFMGGPGLAKVEAKLPVADISFDETVAFIEKLNQWSDTYIFRLPTAIEWEHACRTGKPVPYQTGSTLSEQAAHFLPQDQWPPKVMGPRPVGEGSANAWGLVDMHGNVTEWVALSGSTDEMAELRGGSFQTSAEQCACGYRTYSPKTMHDASLGFRLVVQKKAIKN